MAWWKAGRCQVFALTTLWAVNPALPGAGPRRASGASFHGHDEMGSLRQRQIDRLPIALQRAEAKTQALAHDSAAEPLVHASRRARTTAQRIVWLQRAASAWARPLEAVAACRKGCAHCCHIPVAVSHKEAELLAKASGKAIQEPTAPVLPGSLSNPELVEIATARLQQWGTGTPCPFLVDAACSVYAARPLACRVLINLDDDDLLCQHSAEGPTDVPYADSRMLRALALAAQPAEALADIRDFFSPDAG